LDVTTQTQATVYCLPGSRCCLEIKNLPPQPPIGWLGDSSAGATKPEISDLEETQRSKPESRHHVLTRTSLPHLDGQYLRVNTKSHCQRPIKWVQISI